MSINGYEWLGENFKGALRGCRGVGLLIKSGIKYKIIKRENILIEEGRAIGIEIGNTQIHTIYLPVNTDPQDKIIQHFEGIS